MIFDKNTLPDIEARETAVVAWDAFIAASNKVSDAETGGKSDEEIQALQDEADRLNAIYRGIEGADVLTVGDGDEVMRCAASGAPILVNDDVLTRDADTNCVVLACFLDLPPLRESEGQSDDGELAETYN